MGHRHGNMRIGHHERIEGTEFSHHGAADQHHAQPRSHNDAGDAGPASVVPDILRDVRVPHAATGIA